jgi:glycerophosphoryl diester phosphodiesterase
MMTDTGLAAIAEYAAGIGPWIRQIYTGTDPQGAVQLTDLVQRARARGLLVHPYTLRRDELPEGIEDFDQLLDIFVNRAGVDGLFTDFPDLVRDYLDRAR